ncbi:hypothetical protein Q7C_1595 [Methylophaga frappieri]|uniref:Polymerase nucleotidyl transferase domain-containing protein n=1 Tax=Methylophaga frappieri (strain ATCC BAA-2434 / DSM 25690 / JAM7) TaxID=754477 RepID=I1YIK1_METFJ|nr:nucleotidyltransferase domain-containing protein [Methylophaga frappieri]AFJ02744.1 hypothetical protein Q7C_1595 [Methylophaga frappieri]
MRQTDFPYLPKDFIETDEGLVFAVISYHPHQQHIGCFLRYVKQDGRWQKVDTDTANRLLERHYPDYLYQSAQFDAAFHAVRPDNVVRHYRPESKLAELMTMLSQDQLTDKLQRLTALFCAAGIASDKLGVTGSVLIDNHGPDSDIDFVVYGRDNFHQVRQVVKESVANGTLKLLDETLMHANYERRQSSLNFDDFAWHEQRKFNKAMLDGSKFDIGMVCFESELEPEHRHFMKCGSQVTRARVIDDQNAFDFPARYSVDHPRTPEVICFTHTYVGQAFAGEIIEVAGAVECDNAGNCRIVVGSSREADGEYIKVITKL